MAIARQSSLNGNRSLSLTEWQRMAIARQSSLNGNRSLSLTKWHGMVKSPTCHLAVADCVAIKCHSMPFVVVGLIPYAPKKT
jgi:hypothetical protein